MSLEDPVSLKGPVVNWSRTSDGFRLETFQILSRPLDEVFAFFAAAENLQRITPDFLSFRIITPTPIEMKPGAPIDYRISLHGLPMTWKSRIAIWEPPHRFVDEQISGPYRKWWHEHRFEAAGNSTRVFDCVDYRVLGGVLVEKIFVRQNLLRIFTHRQQVLAEIFPPPTLS